eukprot:COSAG06_NODE_3557_length_5191_cov_9.754910_1_plen_31_part_00
MVAPSIMIIARIDFLAAVVAHVVQSVHTDC